MSEVYNSKRFWQYAKVRFAANRVFFFVPLFIPGIALLLIMSDLVFGGRIGISEASFQIIIGLFAFFIFLIIYSSRAFGEFHRRDRGFMLATLPASGFEKYLFGMLQVTVVFGILYAISYFLSAFMIAGYNHSIASTIRLNEYLKPLTLSSLTEDLGIGVVSVNPMRFYTYLKLILTVSAIFAAGSLFFRRFAFLFTSMAFLLYFWITSNIVSLFITHVGNLAFNSASLIFFLPFSESLGQTPHNSWARVVADTSLFAVLVLLWIASYRRLKEKEY